MNREIRAGLIWAGGIIALALGATLAHRTGNVDSDTVTRLVIGTNGLMIAWYGNRMPKAFVPNAQARQVARVGGWSMFMSGLIYAGLWAFAPITVAVAGGSAAIMAGMAVTLGFCLIMRSKAKAP